MNKIIISSDILKPALDKLGHAVSSKPVLPQLAYMLCKAGDNKIEMTATNTELTISMKLECECPGETFEFLMPFEFLSRIVGMNKHCPLTIECGKKVKVSGPNDAYEFKIAEKIEDFPKLPSLPSKNSIEITQEVLNTLKVALATIGKIESHPQFQYVLLELAPGKITIASSDGSMMVFSKEFENEQQLADELLLSQNLIKVLDGLEVSKMSFTQKVIGIESGDITVISTRADFKYGNFRKVFAETHAANLTIVKDSLVEALTKCSLSKDLMHKTDALLGTDTLKLTADDHIVKINVSVPGQYTGEVKGFSFNNEKFLKVLGQIEPMDIEMAIHDEKRAIIITAKDDPGYKGMLMPMA